MLLTQQIHDIIQENIKNYNGITKQNPHFVYQLILVSIFDKFIKSGKMQTKDVFLNFLIEEKTLWLKNIGIAPKSDTDYAYNEFTGTESDICKKFTLAARFGLVRQKNHSKNLNDDVPFKDIEVTEVFEEITKKCNGDYYDISKYRDIFKNQLLLLTNTHGFFTRLYVIELESLLNEIKFINKEEIKIFHFFFEHKQTAICDKIKLVSETILYLREQVVLNNSTFKDEFEILFSLHNGLKEQIYKIEKEDRLWQTLTDNFNLKYGMQIIYHEKIDKIYLQYPYTFIETEQILNLYKLTPYEFQNYLCQLKITQTQKEQDTNMHNDNFPFVINNYIENYDFTNDFNTVLFPQKILYENQDDNFITSKCNKNIILFGNPNSGKSVYAKDSVLNCYKKEGIHYFHKEIAIPSNEGKPFNKLIAYQDIQGAIHYGTLYETIINSIKNFRTPHINYFDEMGEHDFIDLFGPLKNILKNSNRVDIEKIYKIVPDKIKFINDLKNINSLNTVNNFVNEYKEFINPKNILNIKVGNTELSFFMPTNLLFIGTSNYSPVIKHSLNNLSGFGENGDRFKSIHFYEGINSYSFFESGINPLIKEFNNKLFKIFNKDYSFKYNIKKQIQEVKYQCLISNFHIKENLTLEDLKEYAINSIENGTSIEIDEIEDLITDINDIKIL